MQKGCAAHKPDFCLVNALKRRRTGQAAQAASTAAVVLARPTGPSKAVVPARPAAAARAAYTWVVAAGCHASSGRHAGSVAAQGQLFALSRRIAWDAGLALYVTRSHPNRLFHN